MRAIRDSSPLQSPSPPPRPSSPLDAELVIQLEEFGNWIVTQRKDLEKGQLQELLLAAIKSDIRIEELRDIDREQARKDGLN